MERDNVTQVVNKLIRELDIPVTHQSVEEEIARHPEYQTLLAVSDVLNHWRIPNAAYEMTFDELIAAEVVAPFIAYLKKREFVLVNRIDEQQIIVSNHHWSNHRLSIEEFKNLYGGSMLVAEKEADSGEMDYAVKYRKERLNEIRVPFVITGSVFILIIFLLYYSSFVNSRSWQMVLLTLLKTVGLITSILLLVQSIDTNNPIIQKLCGGDNNKNCNSILSSKAAKVTEELSWSEVGFFYFVGTWLVLLFNSHNISIIQVLAILNIISLPYTFYSIYYQWRVAKQWCRFCCAIQALLWLEFFAFVPYLTSNSLQLPSLRGWAGLFMGMAVPVLAWVFIKPYLLLSKQIQPLKQELRRFKFNADLFNKLLNEEVKYILPDEEHSFIIGNREAEHIITMVSNPYCQPCSKAHKALDEWLAGRDDIKLQVVFSNQDNENDPKTKIGRHLMSLQASHNDVSLKHALSDWYEQKQKDYDAWAKVYPVTAEINSNEALEIQKEWCKTAEIKVTPTIFINGRKLPGNYQTEDIKYFI